MNKDDLAKKFLVFALVYLVSIGGLAYYKNNFVNQVPQIPQNPYVAPVEPEPQRYPNPPNITIVVPSYLDYDPLVSQLKKWNEEAADLTEVGVYGKSSRGQDLYYIRIFNKFDTQDRPRVLITGGIHGNEPWSTGCVMAYIGTLLAEYGKDEKITKLINERDLYFIPVVSPDSYPHSRIVDGVDPNRNFPTERDPNRRSVPPIAALREFFLRIKPDAAASGHTHGRMYLHPPGDKGTSTPHHAEFQRIVGKMGELSKYQVIKASQIYNQNIFGTEVDWYYRNGAFAIIIEFGTHQNKPSIAQIQSEFERTWGAILVFMLEAPLVQINYYHSLRYAA